MKIKSHAETGLFDQNRPDVLVQSLDELYLKNNNGGIYGKIKWNVLIF